MVKAAAGWFARLPDLRQKSAASVSGEYQLRLGWFPCAYHVRYNGLIERCLGASHCEHVDSVLARDGVEQRLELVGSGWECLVSHNKLERDLHSKNGAS